MRRQRINAIAIKMFPTMRPAIIEEGIIKSAKQNKIECIATCLNNGIHGILTDSVDSWLNNGFQKWFQRSKVTVGETIIIYSQFANFRFGDVLLSSSQNMQQSWIASAHDVFDFYQIDSNNLNHIAMYSLNN